MPRRSVYKSECVNAMLCFLPRISCCLACVEPNKLKVSWAPRFLYSQLRPRPAQPLHTSAVSATKEILPPSLSPLVLSAVSVQFVEPSPATGDGLWSALVAGEGVRHNRFRKQTQHKKVLRHRTKNNFYSSNQWKNHKMSQRYILSIVTFDYKAK